MHRIAPDHKHAATVDVQRSVRCMDREQFGCRLSSVMRLDAETVADVHGALPRTHLRGYMNASAVAKPERASRASLEKWAAGQFAVTYLA